MGGAAREGGQRKRVLGVLSRFWVQNSVACDGGAVLSRVDSIFHCFCLGLVCVHQNKISQPEQTLPQLVISRGIAVETRLVCIGALSSSRFSKWKFLNGNRKALVTC